MSKLDNKEVALAAVYLNEGFAASEGIALESWYKTGEGGHIELMMLISEFALDVVSVLNKNIDANFPGVFHYEVTKQFGAWLGQQVAEHGQPPSSKEGNVKLYDMAAKFFFQGRGSDFHEYEIRPVVLSVEDAQACTTFEEAEDLVKFVTNGTIEWGLYGKAECGLYSHIVDKPSKEGMLEFVRQTLGLEIEWNNQDRVTFASPEVG